MTTPGRSALERRQAGRADGRKLRLAASGVALVFSGAVLKNPGRVKEEVMSILTGSAVLLLAAWMPHRQWPSVRFVATASVGLFLAFAGIVGLAAPDATATWLLGAGMAGGGRYWVDSKMRRAEDLERHHTTALIEQVAAAVQGPVASLVQPQPSQLSGELLPPSEVAEPTKARALWTAALAALVAGVWIGRAGRK